MGRMNNIRKYFDWVVLFCCIAGLLIEFLFADIAGVAVSVLGCFGLGYCFYYLIIFFGCPIKRDWILAKGHFLIKVINFVLLIPFVLTLIFSVATIDNKKISAQELIYKNYVPSDQEFRYLSCSSVSVSNLTPIESSLILAISSSTLLGNVYILFSNLPLICKRHIHNACWVSFCANKVNQSSLCKNIN